MLLVMSKSKMFNDKHDKGIKPTCHDKTVVDYTICTGNVLSNLTGFCIDN